MPPEPRATQRTASAGRAAVDWAAIRARVATGAETLRQSSDEREVLRRRAAELARRPASPAPASEQLHLVLFELAGQSYALEAAHVRETLARRELAPLPGLPSTVAGLANVRSRVVPAFDLRPLLQLPAAGAEEPPTLVLVEVEHTEFALLADRVAGSREVPLAQLRREVPALNSHLLRGLFADGLALLDTPGLLRALAVSDELKL